MEDLLTMNAKERERLRIIYQLQENRLTQSLAAKQLGITERQVRRLLQAYRKNGEKGLISRRRGSPSNNRLAEEVTDQVLQLIRENYSDFGPELAHEKLTEEHQLSLSVTSTRGLMIKHGIWQPKKRKADKVHKTRPRRPCYGELVQMDGSYHDWFEGRAEKCCLLVVVDDATSNIMHLEFVNHESSFGYLRVLKKYIKLYGFPISIYTDMLSTFETTRQSEKEFKDTQFHRAMNELGIKLILAHSPQAKGRVERTNGILQDRLIKEMRLLGISSMEEANKYLPTFIKAYNEKFGKQPTSPIDAHRPLTEDCNLDRILCLHYERKIAKDLTISWQSKTYQIVSTKGHHNVRSKKLLVLQHEDNEIELIYKGLNLEFVELGKQPAQPKIRPSEEELLNSWRKGRGHKQKDDHPWKNSGGSTQHENRVVRDGTEG